MRDSWMIVPLPYLKDHVRQTYCKMRANDTSVAATYILCALLTLFVSQS